MLERVWVEVQTMCATLSDRLEHSATDRRREEPHLSMILLTSQSPWYSPCLLTPDTPPVTQVLGFSVATPPSSPLRTMAERI